MKLFENKRKKTEILIKIPLQIHFNAEKLRKFKGMLFWQTAFDHIHKS